MPIEVNLNRPSDDDVHERLAGFVCHRCGKCCTGDGFVRVGEEEYPRLAVGFGRYVDCLPLGREPAGVAFGV